MTRLKTILTTLTILTAGLTVLIAPTTAAETTTPIQFGMESSAINVQTQHDITPDYGTFWIGPWTLKSGWNGPDNQLTTMKNAGVTPALHFYYWGDDITPDCVENGCWSSLHNSQKDRAGWNQLADQMISHLNTRMQGEEVVIFMESEFNKGGIQNYEPFDGYMAEMADKIHDGYPNAKIVLSFGSWGKHAWGNFDRTAAASDLVGIQGMRGSTKDSSAHYDDLYETTLSNAQYIQGLFGKPVFIQDLALSSYPEPSYLDRQAKELQEFFDNLDELKSAGVMAIVYRSWSDSPKMNLENYYGEAERHWGLAWTTSSDLKPAGDVWVAGVKAERGNAAPAPKPAASSFDVTFTVPGNVNEYWVEVKAQGSGIAKVEASHNGGGFVVLPATSWGTHAKSFYAPAGTMVFKATSTTGATVTSETMNWLGGNSAQPAQEPAQPEAPAFSATFTPTAVGNEWWVETGVSSNNTVSLVEARVDAGSYVTLPVTNWDTYAKSFYVAPGATVTFRATDSHGQTAVSQPVVWSQEATSEPATEPSANTSEPAPAAGGGGGGASTPTQTSTSEPTAEPTQATVFEAKVAPASLGSRRHVDVVVDSNLDLSKVEVSINGRGWTTMTETDGEYQKTVRLGRNVDVQFRMTSSDGGIIVSDVIAWR